MFVFLIRDKGKHSWTVLSFLVNLARSCQLYQPLFILGWSFYLPQTRCQRSIVYLFSPCILCLILLLVFLVLTFWIFILYLNIDVLPSKIFIYCYQTGFFSVKKNMKRNASLYYCLFSYESCSKGEKNHSHVPVSWKVTLKSEMRNIIY